MTPLPGSPDSGNDVVCDVVADMFFDVVAGAGMFFDVVEGVVFDVANSVFGGLFDGAVDDAIAANAAGDKPIIIGPFAIMECFAVSAPASLCANC